MYYPQRPHQIDYLFGWRFLFSPELRAQVRRKANQSRWLWTLYMLGGSVSLLLSTLGATFLIFLAWQAFAS
jgi:hypothetical protein